MKKMKKILKFVFTLFLMISFSTTFACGTCGCQDKKTNIETSKDTDKKETVVSSKVEQEKILTSNKKAKSCCKTDKKETSCSKNKQANFNFEKTNNYAKKMTSCNMTEKKKGCCKVKNKTDESTSSIK